MWETWKRFCAISRAESAMCAASRLQDNKIKKWETRMLCEPPVALRATVQGRPPQNHHGETSAEKSSNKVGYFINDKIGETSSDFMRHQTQPKAPQYGFSGFSPSSSIALTAWSRKFWTPEAVENFLFRSPRAGVAHLHQYYR